MANHLSTKKRIRQNEEHRLRNKYVAKTARNAVRDIRAITTKAEAEAQLPKVTAMLDKLVKTNILHKNKAANLKSGLAVHINGL